MCGTEDPLEETLELTTEFSLGRITVYLKGNSVQWRFWTRRESVRGPKGATLYLDLSQEVCDDLQKLCQMCLPTC